MNMETRLMRNTCRREWLYVGCKTASGRRRVDIFDEGSPRTPLGGKSLFVATKRVFITSFQSYFLHYCTLSYSVV